MEGAVLTERRGRALVIGAGVSGLTTALCLRRAGFGVTVVAEKLARDLVSVVAGALWEWPPAVCGYHSDQHSVERSKEWCVRSYGIFSELSRDAATTGVYLRPVIFYYRYRLEERPGDLAKMHELRDKVEGFRRDPALGEDHGVNPNFGVRDAYTHLAPMIDTDTYMSWLMSKVQEAGFQLVPGRIEGNLVEQEADLKDRYGADVIVNCAGLGARTLTGEAMFPLRGALVRVRNDGRTMPPITTAHCVPHDTEAHANEQDMVFIVPRGRDMLILGGLTEMNEWDLDIGLRNYGPVRDMLRRCRNFLPVLEQAVIDGDEPVRAGLRPFRHQNVRLEREPGTSIIHNYGHGGSGVTFSWGCGEEVASLVNEIVPERV